MNKWEKAKIHLEINEGGFIIEARENGKPLEYGDGEKEKGKTMDDGKSCLQSNPCRWVKIGGVWRCI